MSFFLDSVLEQFSISVISTNHWLVCVATTSMDQLGIGMLFTANYLPLVLRFLQIVGGLFYPTPISTKNFAYNRIARFIFQLYMSLFIRSRRLIFWRNNVLIVKLKLQIKIMQAVRSNFGIHYPYINRLLNYYPYFLTILGLVLLQNLMGLFFYGFTNTAFLVQNFWTSFQAIVGLTIIGIFVRSYNFYKMFVPSNVPTLLIPFLVVIEVISHIAKMFSLSIRLFANMMSGHVLLHILMGFILKLGQQNLTFVFLPGVLIGCIILLEYGISLLQGYVFLTLLAIYFEEHFGFDQEEKLEVAKLVTINGQMNYIAKPTFLKDYLAYEEREECLIYFNRREKGRMARFVYWDYTIITLVPLNKVRLSYAGNSVVSSNF